MYGENIILLFYVIVIHIRVVFQPTVKLVSFKKKTKPKTKNYGWVDSCIRVCLEIVYLTETEIFFAESTVSTLKVAKILQYDSWIIPKSVMGPMNSSKNKLNSSKNWFFKPMPNAHEKYNETCE